MSKLLRVVFIHGNNLFSKVIQEVEEIGEKIHGDDGILFIPTHVGLIVDGEFREALIDGFVGENIRRYKHPNMRIYDLIINDEQNIKMGDSKWSEILGKPYSLKACLNAGIYTIFGIPLPNTENEECSGDVVEVLRAYGIEIKNDIPASDITPNILMELIDNIGILEVD